VDTDFFCVRSFDDLHSEGGLAFYTGLAKTAAAAEVFLRALRPLRAGLTRTRDFSDLPLRLQAALLAPVTESPCPSPRCVCRLLFAGFPLAFCVHFPPAFPHPVSR